MIIQSQPHPNPKLTLIKIKYVTYNFCLQDRDEQTKLEMKHRQEEDDLYRKFSKHREEENRRIREEIQVSNKCTNL